MSDAEIDRCLVNGDWAYDAEQDRCINVRTRETKEVIDWITQKQSLIPPYR